MRALVNRYMAWAFDTDTDDAGMLFRMGVSMAILAVVLALFVGGITVLVVLGTANPDHGSCAVGHYGAKGAFVCDTWYPTPRVEEAA